MDPEVEERMQKEKKMSDKSLAIMEHKGENFKKEVKKMGELYSEWFKTKRPNWIVDDGDMSCFEFLKTIEKEFAPNTLWVKFHYLKNYLNLLVGLPLEGAHYRLVTEYLKKLQNGYEPKKAAIFSIWGKEGLGVYWGKKAETNHMLLFQVMSLAAVFAADRSIEVSITVMSDIKICKEERSVEITSKRAKGKRIRQRHIIPSTEEWDAVDIFERYIAAAHPQVDLNNRFFRNVHAKSKNFYNSPTGKNHWTVCSF